MENTKFPSSLLFWKNKKVLVTGGAGFLGTPLCARLTALGAQVSIPRKRDFDLTRQNEVQACLIQFQPDIVFHLAAFYGGLGLTMEQPGKIFYENLIMGTQLMEASRQFGVEKFITVGTNCGYPGYLGKSMTEEDFWAGPVHESVAAYGTAKKMLHAQGVAYRQQYGFNAIYVIPTNLYGPGDHFEDARSHVTAALIKKFFAAQEKNQSVTLWGTGAAVRDFLYVDDAAVGILLAAERYNDSSPLNLAAGVGTSIRELAETIAGAIGFTQKILWDKTKPDGQALKTLDATKMKQILNWTPPTKLLAGLRTTIDWYHSVASSQKAA